MKATYKLDTCACELRCSYKAVGVKEPENVAGEASHPFYSITGVGYSQSHMHDH